jgi:hypothetical protein
LDRITEKKFIMPRMSQVRDIFFLLLHRTRLRGRREANTRRNYDRYRR